MREHKTDSNSDEPPQRFSALKVEARLLPVLALTLALNAFSGFLTEQWILTNACWHQQVDSCADAAVGSAAAFSMRKLSLAGSATAFVVLPFVGMASDAIKATAGRRDPTVRARLLLLQMGANLGCSAILWCQAQYYLPMALMVVARVVANLTGGVFALLPTLFALRADLSTPEERPTAFLRVEFSMFLGISVGVRSAGFILRESDALSEREATQRFAFSLHLAASLLILLVTRIALRDCPPAPEEPSGSASPKVAYSGRRASATTTAAASPAAASSPPSAASSGSAWSDSFRRLASLWTTLHASRGYLGLILLSFFLLSCNNGVGPSLLLYYNSLGWSPTRASYFASAVFAASAVHLLLGPLYLALMASPERLLAFSAIGGALGYGCLALGTSSLPFLLPGYTWLYSLTNLGFPTVRGIVARLVPLEQAGIALTALGICEHIAQAAAEISYLSLYGLVMASAPTLPIWLGAAQNVVCAASALAAAPIAARRASRVPAPPLV